MRCYFSPLIFYLFRFSLSFFLILFTNLFLPFRSFRPIYPSIHFFCSFFDEIRYLFHVRYAIFGCCCCWWSFVIRCVCASAACNSYSKCYHDSICSNFVRNLICTRLILWLLYAQRCFSLYLFILMALLLFVCSVVLSTMPSMYMCVGTNDDTAK